MDLVTENVVITANEFNPSIFNQHWLITNGIMAEGEMLEGGIFIPVMSQCATARFHLLVLDARLQLTPKGDEASKQDTVTRVIGRILELLPQTPYAAIGINFSWNFEPRTGIQEGGRSLFYNAAGPLHEVFNSPDARYGGYYSADMLGMRMKLMVLPKVLVAGGERLDFAFNFHADVDGPEQLRAHIGQWANAKACALEIADRAERAI